MTVKNEGVQSSFSSYTEAVEWVNGLVNNGIKPGLARMEALMDKLGDPHLRLRYIHVAGTNGKGSTCAFLSRALLGLGYDVGTFTSPYMEKFTNRIQYNGQDIEEEQVVALLNRIKEAADEISQGELGYPTMFEIVTAMAILYFAKVKFPDYVVLETGLGGMYDSTNIVFPVVSVITNIGKDHTEFLGQTTEEIARQKAGIIKAGVPVVSAVKQAEAVKVLEETANQKKSSLYLLGRQFSYEAVERRPGKQIFHFSGPFRRYENVTISMDGAHQMENASVALMTLEVLRQYNALVVEDEDLFPSFQAVTWPGRMELVRNRPGLLLDGAHNPEGAQALAAAIRETYSYEKLHMMMGMLEMKHHGEVLRHILPIVDSLIITEPQFRKKMDAFELEKITRDICGELGIEPEITVEPDWKKALGLLEEKTTERDLGVVTGSLYLVSDVRSWVLYGSKSEKGW